MVPSELWCSLAFEVRVATTEGFEGLVPAVPLCESSACPQEASHTGKTPVLEGAAALHATLLSLSGSGSGCFSASCGF